MDIIIELLVFLVRALFGKSGADKRNVRENPSIQTQIERATAARVQAVRDKAASQEPVYDDGGWRLVLAVLALITLIVMAVVWAMYVRGEL